MKYLFFLLIGICMCGTIYAQNIAPNVPFDLPLVDGTKVRAVALQGPGYGYIVYVHNNMPVILTVSTGPVPPGPIVVPVPPGPVPPVNKKCFGVIFEETSQRQKLPAETIKTMLSTSIVKAYHDAGGDFRVIDKDAVGKDGKMPVELESFAKEAKDDKGVWKVLPCLVVTNKEGVQIYNGPVPSEKEIINLLTK